MDKTTTETPPMLRLGDLALVCSNERDSRHRCITVFDVSEPGPRRVDGDELTGTFVTSYYLSTVIARGQKAEAAEDWVLQGREHAVKAEDWPAVYAWAKDMSRWS